MHIFHGNGNAKLFRIILFIGYIFECLAIISDIVLNRMNVNYLGTTRDAMWVKLNKFAQ